MNKSIWASLLTGAFLFVSSNGLQAQPPIPDDQAPDQVPVTDSVFVSNDELAERIKKYTPDLKSDNLEKRETAVSVIGTAGYYGGVKNGAAACDALLSALGEKDPDLLCDILYKTGQVATRHKDQAAKVMKAIAAPELKNHEDSDIQISVIMAAQNIGAAHTDYKIPARKFIMEFTRGNTHDRMVRDFANQNIQILNSIKAAQPQP